MTIISRQAIVPYTALQMYLLVDDIAAYPSFLPWCDAAHIIERTPDEVKATLVLVKGSIRKSFTTCNRLQSGKMIEIRLVSGPFKHLEGFWRFDDLGEKSCKVSLDLEFEFSNRLIAMALGSIFNQIAETFVQAFTKRAQDVYGK